MDTSASTIQPVQYNEQDKQRHVIRWLSSGQSKKVYSDTNGLRYGTFKNWVEKYHGSTPKVNKEANKNFVSLELNSNTGSSVGYAEIHYPDGSKLVIHKPIPIEELRRLLP